jgi:signal transduction histidine kinase/ligand-binding sensor domain-containing protein
MTPIRWLLLILLGAALAYGLDPGRRISQYDKRTWRVEDGLPHTYVMSVAPGLDGYLLVGTDEGLARFDGLQFSPYDIDAHLRLSKRWILRLARVRDGSLWIGTFDGWMYRMRDGRVLDAYDAGASVFSIVEDDGGTIWASTRNGILQFANGRFHYLKGFKRPPDTAWETLSTDGRGAVWIVTIDGLFRSRGGVVERVAASGGAYGSVLSVKATGRELFAGTSTGLYRIYEASGVSLKRFGDIAAPVVTMHADRRGSLWIGTWGNGLHRLSASTAEAWTSREGLPDDFVRTLYEDPDGNLWIGTRAGGLSRWKDTPILAFGTPEGLSGNFASTVVPASDGSVWLGTWRGGLYRRRSGAIEPQPSPVPTLYLTVRALALDSQGRPWIGNWEGLNGLVGGVYRHFGDSDSPYLHVSAIVFDRRGRLWLGTSENGVFLFPEGVPGENYSAFVRGEGITSLVEDPQGRIWAGTGKGIRFLDPGATVPAFSEAASGNGEEIAAVSTDAKGRVWAATMSGRLCMALPDRGCLSARNGLPGHPLYRLVDDGAGSYWIGSPRGILQLATGDVDDVLEGRARKLPVAWYGQHDGMRSIECHRMSQPSGGRAADGAVWFTTTQGFVQIFPDRVKTAAAPKVRLEDLTLDGRSVPTSQDVEVPPGTHALEVRYTALEFSSPEKVRFRYRLEGFDPDWVDAGADRSMRYSGLPPGSYRLLVAARSGIGPWSEPLAAATVRQMPRFYQTGWFAALMVVLLAGVVLLVVRWRLHIVRARYALILAERNRISGEWHDTLLAGFAAISWQIEEALSRMADLPTQLRDPVALALKMLGHYRAEARRVIWDLREDRPETETLSDSVRVALERLAAGTAIETAVDVVGLERRLPAEHERNILRICQEAATNAKRHAAPHRITVRMEYANDRLSVVVSDDGSGFDPQSRAGLQSGHFGLAVMEERAQRLGGLLRLESRPGAGTIVETEIPFRPA